MKCCGAIEDHAVCGLVMVAYLRTLPARNSSIPPSLTRPRPQGKKWTQMADPFSLTHLLHRTPSPVRPPWHRLPLTGWPSSPPPPRSTSDRQRLRTSLQLQVRSHPPRTRRPHNQSSTFTRPRHDGSRKGRIGRRRRSSMSTPYFSSRTNTSRCFKASPTAALLAHICLGRIHNSAFFLSTP